MGGTVLSVICRLLCEEYYKRIGGVPDLIVWNATEGLAKFVEVKGPGDTLMETQKVRPSSSRDSAVSGLSNGLFVCLFICHEGVD
jgi:hypothetical protein